MTKAKGLIFIMLSAIIFGFTPILARMAYEGGGNGLTLVFLRTALCLPLLFLVLKYKKISLKISKKELKQILILGVFGFAITAILLYTSYSFISVGLATTLHFVYPLLIVLGCAVFFKEKLDCYKIIAVCFATAGILLFGNGQSGGSLPGLILAFLSGALYAFYVIYMDKSGLKEMHYFKLAFYLNLVVAVFSGIYGTVTHTLTLHLTSDAWVQALLVSFFTTLGAMPLFQIGLQSVGASTAGILSTLEPITSIVCGAIVLKEHISVPKLFGCALILISVILTAVSQKKMAVNNSELEV